MGSDTAIYATFVMSIVAEEDSSRAVWPSCPALGWTEGVWRLDSRPSGSALRTPSDGPTIETHGDYQHGSGFPAVNGAASLQLFDSLIPLPLKPTETGLHLPNVFASEVGFSREPQVVASLMPLLAASVWSRGLFVVREYVLHSTGEALGPSRRPTR